MTILVALALLYLAVSWLQLLVWFSWTGALARVEECYRTPGFPWAPETEAQHRARCLAPVEVRVDAVWLRLPPGEESPRPRNYGARAAYTLASAIILILHILLVPVIAFHALRKIRMLQDQASRNLEYLRALGEIRTKKMHQAESEAELAAEAESLAEAKSLAADLADLRKTIEKVEAHKAQIAEVKITYAKMYTPV